MLSIIKIFLALFLVAFWLPSYSQLPAIGQWRDHLPYHRAKAVTETPDKVFCATPYAVFSYNKSDNSIARISKATGLSDIGVSTIKYHTASGFLIIAYNNGNIDLYKEGSIINISDIKRSLITAGKNINRITIINNLAYLSCGFGISVLDVAKKEIKATYFIGDSGTYLNTNDIAVNAGKFFAATSLGVYVANANSPNLADFKEWKKQNTLPVSDGNYNHVEAVGNKIIVNLRGIPSVYESDSLYEYKNSQWTLVDSMINTLGAKEPLSGKIEIHSIEAASNKILITANGQIRELDDSWNSFNHIYTYGNNLFIEPNHAIYGMEENTLWIADSRQGLIKNQKTWSNEIITPNGAASIFSYQMDASGGNLWVATGKRVKNNGNNWWLYEGLMSFTDEKWTHFDKDNTNEMKNIFDFITVKIDPSDNNRVFTGSLGAGVLEFYDEKPIKLYNHTNSSLTYPASWEGYIGISGLDFDSQNNLWVVNNVVPNALSVKTSEGKWQSFPIPELSNEIYLGNILVTEAGQKWIELPNKGIVVFDDNGTISNLADDKSILLGNAEGNGGLHDLAILAMAEDRDGKIWVGSASGISVFHSPGNVFSGGNFDAQRILVSQGGYTGYLLETEAVIAIAVDGANRKWVGTDGAGVFLISSDGTEQLLHFTEENSPLLSNFISCIAINDKTGEVFFGTENGICSYKSDATEGNDEFNNVYAYPNPVKSGYDGPIAIKNLVTNANVKITDVSGSLVYETTALGGQAIWQGKDFNGNRIKSGVYLAFCSNADGTKTIITKILFIN